MISELHPRIKMRQQSEQESQNESIKGIHNNPKQSREHHSRIKCIKKVKVSINEGNRNLYTGQSRGQLYSMVKRGGGSSGQIDST